MCHCLVNILNLNPVNLREIFMKQSVANANKLTSTIFVYTQFDNIKITETYISVFFGFFLGKYRCSIRGKEKKKKLERGP